MASLLCKNQKFFLLFEKANGFDLLKSIIEEKDKRDEIQGNILCLLYKLASNSRPNDEIGSIEEMIEENELTKPIFQKEKLKFL